MTCASSREYGCCTITHPAQFRAVPVRIPDCKLRNDDEGVVPRYEISDVMPGFPAAVAFRGISMTVPEGDKIVLMVCSSIG